jgi:hypothetical protein
MMIRAFGNKNGVIDMIKCVHVNNNNRTLSTAILLRRISSYNNAVVDDRKSCYSKCTVSRYCYSNYIYLNRYDQPQSLSSRYQRCNISSLSLSLVPQSLPDRNWSPTILRRGISGTTKIAFAATDDNDGAIATKNRSGNDGTTTAISPTTPFITATRRQTQRKSTNNNRDNRSKIKRKSFKNNDSDLSLDEETQHLMKILEEEYGGGNDIHHRRQKQKQQMENQQLRDKTILVSDRCCYKLLEQWKFRIQRTKNLREARMARDLFLRIRQSWTGTRLEDTLNILFYDLVLEILSLAATTNTNTSKGVGVESGVVEADEFLCTNIPLKLLTAKSFHIVMNAYAKSGSELSGRKVQKLYDRLEYIYSVNINNQQQKQKQNDQQQKATTILNNANLRPNHRTLTILLEAWANSDRSTEAPERIIAIFRTIMERNGYHEPQEKAEEVEQQRQQLHQTALSGADKGDLILFNTLMRSLVSTFGNRWAAETCEQILELLIQTDYDGDSYQEHSESTAPNNNNNSSRKGGCRRLQADTQTYSIVLNAWAKCESIERGERDAAQRAHDVLHRMIRLYSYGSNVKPNIKSFTSCIAAWSRAGQPQRAENVLDELLLLNIKSLDDNKDINSSDPQLRPDVAAWNAVLMAWSRSGRNASVETERMLEKMRAFAKPNIRSYNSLLHAYSQERDKMVVALALLKWLEDESSISNSSETSLAPDIVSYNTILNALARDRSQWAAEKSTQLLQSVEDASSRLVPDVVSYTSVIRALGNSGITSPLDRVVEIFQRFLLTDRNQVKNITITGITRPNNKNKNRIPDRVILTTYLQALGKERKKIMEGLEQIVQVFDVIDLYNVVLFDDSLFVLAIDSVIQITGDTDMYNKNRNDSIAAIFTKCCSHGMVSRRLLDKIRRTVSHGHVESITGLSPNGNMPKDWTRNIKR